MNEQNRDQPTQPGVQLPFEEYVRMLSLLSRASELKTKIAYFEMESERFKNIKAYYVDETQLNSSIDQTPQMTISSMELPKRIGATYQKLSLAEKQQLRNANDKQAQENINTFGVYAQELIHVTSELNDIIKKYTPKDFHSQYPALHNGTGTFRASNTSLQQNNNTIPENNQTNTSSSSTSSTSNSAPGGS
jgi:hypothetical protein